LYSSIKGKEISFTATFSISSCFDVTFANDTLQNMTVSKIDQTKKGK